MFALCPSVVTHTKQNLGSFYFGFVIYKEKRSVQVSWAMPWLTGLPPSLLTPLRNLVEVQHLGLVLVSWNSGDSPEDAGIAVSQLLQVDLSLRAFL